MSYTAANIYIDDANGYAVAREQGPKSYVYWPPEINDKDSFFFTQRYVQTLADFVPLLLDTPHDTISGVYLVEESEPRDIGGGCVEFVRTWATIPKSWRRYESYGWTVPGLDSLDTPYAIRAVTGQSTTGGTDTVTTAASVGGSTGDFVTIVYNVFYPDGSQTSRRVLRTITAGGTTSTSFTAVVDISAPQYVNIQRVDVGREPLTEVVGSIVMLDYFLPGVTPNCTTPDDIPRLEPDTIIDNTGQVVQSYAVTSTPTRADWLAKIGTLVIVEASNVVRWRGNIYERGTRYCIAK